MSRGGQANGRFLARGSKLRHCSAVGIAGIVCLAGVTGAQAQAASPPAAAPGQGAGGAQAQPQQRQGGYCGYYTDYYRRYYPQYYLQHCVSRQPQTPAPSGPAHGHAPPPAANAAPPASAGWPASGSAPPAAPSAYGQPAAPSAYSPPPYVPPPDEVDDGEPPNFDLAVGTVFPLGFGPEITLEIPGRLFFQTDLLWMPGFYGAAIVGIIESVGVKGAVIGPAVEDALANSFVFQISGGWRPFTDYGFEFFGGYTGIVASGDVSPEIVSDLVGGTLGRQVGNTVIEAMPVSAHLHNFHLALGWRFLAADDHLVIRINAGYTQTVGSSTSLEIPDFPELDEQAAIDRFTEELDDVVTSDLKLPVIGLAVGYRF